MEVVTKGRSQQVALMEIEPAICIDGESQRVESPVEPTIFIDGERRCTVLKRPTIRRHAREMMFDGMNMWHAILWEVCAAM